MAPAATMKAVRIHAPGSPVVLEDVAYPEPGPGEVVVRVGACGICGSDVHFLEGMPVLAPLPMTLGHEPAGIVESVGDGVSGWAPGDRVAMHLSDGCGICAACVSGHPMCCPNLAAVGLHFDGAFAEAVRVPAGSLVRVPDEVSLAAAAIATDCVATPYHALTCRARMREGEKVAVIGAGGLGSMVVSIARHLGAGQIVAVDTNPAAVERAARLGATDTVLVTDRVDTASAIREATGTGADIAVECIGSSATVASGVMGLAAGGRCVCLGVGLETPRIDLPLAMFAILELSVIGTFASHMEDVETVLALAASGQIDIEGAISHRIPLEEAASGLELLQKGGADVQRIVVEPNGRC